MPGIGDMTAAHDRPTGARGPAPTGAGPRPVVCGGSAGATTPSWPPSGDPDDADRARGCLLGLAAGDSLGRPAENLEPAEIRHRWGRLTDLEEGPTGAPACTDDTEYAIFTALLLQAHGLELSSQDVARAWRDTIAATQAGPAGPMRGAGFSELGTVLALRRGLEPPLSGRWHHHGWSDGLAMRAAPYGIFAAGEPAEAARLAAVDGAVSHSGEGIHGGRAVAAAVAVAMTGAAPAQVVEAGLATVPADSWTARSIRASVRVVEENTPAGTLDDHMALTARLHAAVVSPHCPWTDLAPEAVSLAFAAYLSGGGEVEESVVAAVNLGRDADTIGAMAGALAGAGRGESGVPRRWAEAIGPVTGACLPAVTGLDVREVADALVAAARRARAVPSPTEGAGGCEITTSGGGDGHARADPDGR
ncbi:MAG: ADP-ribosylglycohydrolase [Streptosporangiaceae bacterium]|nr:ADP-ribosylglycohydrolase [Streptosporangiaceae bacterium]